MDSSSLLAAALFFITLTFFISSRRRRNLPPGPFPYPIIGNMLQLGSEPHQSFAKLSKKYGPMTSIYLGGLYTVVVSSPEIAKEVLHKHGQVFSGRIVPHAVHASDHNKVSMGFLPTGGVWRDMRKICKEQMFSHSSLEASQGLRQRKLQQLLDFVQKCADSGRAVDVREALYITSLNLMSASMFSTQATEFDSKLTMEFKEITEGISNMVSMADYADYFPILKPFDLQGLKRKVEGYFAKMLAIIDRHLKERLDSRKANPDAPKKTDFLETLVDMMEGNEYNLTIDHLTHLMLDLFTGGIETTTITIEWIMSELVANQDKMAKVKSELKSVVGDKQLVDESDIPKLPYLQAAIKEALRLHPAGPLLLPRKAESDQEVNGYLIPKGTQVCVNAWGMGRDPSIWKNPETFEPERFLNQTIDFKGQDFKLIPFGSGRRSCPGMPLANRMMHTTIAALVHNFDCKLEQGAVDVDNTGVLMGLTLRRTVPLRIIPFKP